MNKVLALLYLLVVICSCENSPERHHEEIISEQEAWDTMMAVPQIREASSVMYPSGSFHKLVLAKVPDDKNKRYEFHIKKIFRRANLDTTVFQVFYVNSVTKEIRLRRVFNSPSDTSTASLDEWLQIYEGPM